VGLAVALALAPASAPAQSIQTDYDRSFDFSRLKTYDFAQQTRRPNDPLAVNPINDRQVQAALDSQLVAHGHTRDPSGKTAARSPHRCQSLHREHVDRGRHGCRDQGAGVARRRAEVLMLPSSISRRG
jgi:hypothetical protein